MSLSSLHGIKPLSRAAASRFLGHLSGDYPPAYRPEGKAGELERLQAEWNADNRAAGEHACNQVADKEHYASRARPQDIDDKSDGTGHRRTCREVFLIKFPNVDHVFAERKS